MEIVVSPEGNARFVYSETVDLASLGKLAIRRGSHVEPDDTGKWVADLWPVRGPRLGPFTKRTKALAAELQWLHDNWLVKGGSDVQNE
jgi:hypothetical protein